MKQIGDKILMRWAHYGYDGLQGGQKNEVDLCKSANFIDKGDMRYRRGRTICSTFSKGEMGGK